RASASIGCVILSRGVPGVGCPADRRDGREFPRRDVSLTSPTANEEPSSAALSVCIDRARVAELADALGLGSRGGDSVGGQLPPLAPRTGGPMRGCVHEIGACKRRLDVEETPEVVKEAWERAFVQVQKEARLPGFRKGKVPRSMIKLHFGDDVRQEVARRLIPEVYRQALAETQIQPVEEPDLEQVTLEESAPLKFSAVVEIRPTITLGQYVGLNVTHSPKPFAETEEAEALGQLQEQHAEYRAVERPADVGDLVIVDYTLTPDGMEPRSETGYSFTIGSGAVMPEIDEAAIGLAPGGSRQTRVRFGDTHANENLRGKAADARVRVTEVKEKVLPALDDDFARSIGEFETLDALRAEVRRGL